MLRTQICSRLRTSFASRSEVRVRTRARARARASSSEAFFSGERILSAGPGAARMQACACADSEHILYQFETRGPLSPRNSVTEDAHHVSYRVRWPHGTVARADMCARLVVGWSQAWHLQRMYPRSARSDLAATHIWHDTFRPLSLGSAAPTDTVCLQCSSCTRPSSRSSRCAWNFRTARSLGASRRSSLACTHTCMRPGWPTAKDVGGVAALSDRCRSPASPPTPRAGQRPTLGPPRRRRTHRAATAAPCRRRRRLRLPAARAHTQWCGRSCRLRIQASAATCSCCSCWRASPRGSLPSRICNRNYLACRAFQKQC